MNGPSEIAWHKLDNAAKIFPPTSSKSDTKVFRFSCELTEAVDGVLLQSALERTIEDFPVFRYILKRGMFWYYLEQSDIIPLTHEEDTPPCSTVYMGSKSLLFDVTWYMKRINLEMYHALTDGTGALQFFKTLVLYYLKLAHPEAMQNVTGIDYDASYSQKLSESYSKFYDKSKKTAKPKKNIAYLFKGPKEAERRLKIIEGALSTKALLGKARELDTTATVLISALLMRAIYAEMRVRDRKKPVVVTVPVNLRNYFESKSALNFFSIVDVKYDFSTGDDSLSNLISTLKKQFSEQLSIDFLQSRLNKLFSFERNFLIRPIPLPVKDLILGVVSYLSSRENTASVSNLGRITMPDEAKPYIRLFDVFISTKKLQICVCSFEDTMNISFTSPFISTDVQRGFFRQLTQMGIAVEISANRTFEGGRFNENL